MSKVTCCIVLHVLYKYQFGILLRFLMLFVNVCFCRYVDISFNRCTAVEGLGRLTKLRKLYLPSNKFRKIENISHLSQLVLLELGANQIRVNCLRIVVAIVIYNTFCIYALKFKLKWHRDNFLSLHVCFFFM